MSFVPVRCVGTCCAKMACVTALDQLLGPIRQAVDVARDDRAAGAGDFRRPNRRVVVHIVHVDDAGGGQRLGRQFALAQAQAVVAIPQHDALAGRGVDENHRELVFGVTDDEIGDVDVAVGQLGADPAAVLVGA